MRIEIQLPTPATLKVYGFGTGYIDLMTGEVLNPEEDWRAMLASQGGVCGVCGRVPTTGKFVTDHEHVRGWKQMPPERRRLYVRGLVCWWCNHYYLGRGITVAKAEGVVRFLKAYAERRPA